MCWVTTQELRHTPFGGLNQVLLGVNLGSGFDITSSLVHAEQSARCAAGCVQAQQLVEGLRRRQRDHSRGRRGREADAAVARFSTETQRALDALLNQV